MGYAGRDSETESAHPGKLRKDARPPSTVYVWFVVPIYRRNSREDLRQRRFSVLTFLRVRQKAKSTLLRVSHRFSCKVARINKEF